MECANGPEALAGPLFSGTTRCRRHRLLLHPAGDARQALPGIFWIDQSHKALVNEEPDTVLPTQDSVKRDGKRGMPKDMDDDQSDDVETGGPEAAPQGLRGRLPRGKLLLFAAVPAVLVVALGAAYALGAFGSAAESEPKETASVGSVFYDLPELLVNLSSQNNRSSYLKLRVALELPGVEMPKELEKMAPRIVDNFQVYLRELRASDLEGSSGMFRLKEELLARVNVAVAPVKVSDVLFKEMLVQ